MFKFKIRFVKISTLVACILYKLQGYYLGAGATCHNSISYSEDSAFLYFTFRTCVFFSQNLPLEIIVAAEHRTYDMSSVRRTRFTERVGNCRNVRANAKEQVNNWQSPQCEGKHERAIQRNRQLPQREGEHACKKKR
jgi:hypothetical protein